MVGGISLAARQLFVEFQRIKELQQTDADKQVEFEQSLVQAVRNANGLLGGQEVKQIALNLEKEAGVSPIKVAQAISTAFSARGATNKEQAQEAVTATSAALRYAPELSAQESAFVAGAGIDMSKRFGYTPEQAIGYVQNVGGLARVTDLPMLAKNVVPAVNNLSQFGNTAQESGSLVAAMTQGIGDKFGEMTGTAAVQLAKQIRDRGIGGSTAEGIQLLQEDPKLRKKFLEGGTFNGKSFPKASFEGKADPTVRDLLDKNSFIAKSFKDGIDLIGGAADAQKTYNSIIAENEKITRISRLRRQSSAAADTANIQDDIGGLAASVRETLNKALDSANISDIRKKALIAEFELRSSAGQESPLQAGEAILSRERRRLLNPVEYDAEAFSGLAGGPGAVSEGRKREPTQGERQSADVLDRFEKILEDFIQEQKRAQQPPQQQQTPPSDIVDALVKQNSIIERIFGQNNTPVVPAAKPPFKLAAERLNRGAT